ncbi:hypothetical protein C2E23DRAFT_880117 [Lenzites betulinus]|nr:hypothetical protein C2E23DRAFT_880117 [Lenzites betulinus]
MNADQGVNQFEFPEHENTFWTEFEGVVLDHPQPTFYELQGFAPRIKHLSVRIRSPGDIVDLEQLLLGRVFLSLERLHIHAEILDPLTRRGVQCKLSGEAFPRLFDLRTHLTWVKMDVSLSARLRYLTLDAQAPVLTDIFSPLHFTRNIQEVHVICRVLGNPNTPGLLEMFGAIRDSGVLQGPTRVRVSDSMADGAAFSVLDAAGRKFVLKLLPISGPAYALPGRKDGTLTCLLLQILPVLQDRVSIRHLRVAGVLGAVDLALWQSSLALFPALEGIELRDDHNAPDESLYALFNALTFRLEGVNPWPQLRDVTLNSSHRGGFLISQIRDSFQQRLRIGLPRLRSLRIDLIPVLEWGDDAVASLRGYLEHPRCADNLQVVVHPPGGFDEPLHDRAD